MRVEAIERGGEERGVREQRGSAARRSEMMLTQISEALGLCCGARAVLPGLLALSRLTMAAGDDSNNDDAAWRGGKDGG